MKKLFPLAVLLVFMSSFIATQNTKYEVDWGQTYKKEGARFAISFLIGGSDNHYYELSRPKKVNELKKYNSNNQLVSTNKIDLKFGKTNVFPTTVLNMKSGDYLYMPYYDKKAKKYSIYTSKFNNGKITPTKLFHSVNVENAKKRSYGFSVVSNDSSYLAYVRSTTFNKNEGENFSITLFDSELNKIWQKEVAIKVADKNVNVTQTRLSNNGDILMSTRVWKDSDEKEKGLPNYDYKVFVVNQEGSKSFDIFKGADIALSESGLFDGKNGNIFLGGFYTEKGKNVGEKGVFYAKINTKTGEVINKSHEFDEAFLSGLVRSKKIEKGKGLSGSRYNIDYYFNHKNGTFSFIAENYYVTTHTSTYTDSNGNVKTRTYYVYHSNQLIIPRFSENGELVSLEKIDKKFQSQSPAIVSYTLAKHNDKIYMLFNDHKTNEEREDIKIKGKTKKRDRYTDLLVLDENGEVEYRETLFSSRVIETEFIPRRSMQIGDRLIVGGLNRNNYQYGTLHLE